MLPDMKWIALRRLNVWALPRGPGLGAKAELTLHAELAQLGCRLKNPEQLAACDPTGLADFERVVTALKTQEGAGVPYVPLFSGFPDTIPDDDLYFSQRLMGAVGNLLGAFSHGTRLENGLIVPPWLFDLAEFGADPITQLHSDGLFDAALERVTGQRPDRHIQWRNLEIIFEDELRERAQAFLQANLYARSSIKEALHDDLRALITQLGLGCLDVHRISQRESLALVLEAAWVAQQPELLQSLVRSPTDVLRMFAALTRTDISLAKPVRFPKMSRPQRRWALGLLEARLSQTPEQIEDLQRHRGLWLALGQSLHPGGQADKFPCAAAAFDMLRNQSITTFASTTERLLAERDAQRLLSHLAHRPGVLGRKLHELLRRCPEATEQVLAQFQAHAPRMQLKNLLVLRAYFGTINDDPHRTVLNKRGTIRVLPNTSQGALSAAQIEGLCRLLDRVVQDQLQTRPTWADEAVWIDPELAFYTVPLQQRAASDGLLSFGRGSHVPVDFRRVLRLFVYWKQTEYTTDLDLSLIQLDEGFGYAGHVSYTNLKSQGIAHSGDMRSAPRGAAEFIDITLSQIPPKVRYLVAQVHRFSGENFADMRCHAGWMLREDVNPSIRTFDIRTVVDKFDLTGRTSFCVPLVVDLHARRVVLTDLCMGAGTLGSNVEGSHEVVALACQQLVRFLRTRPTLMDLALRHLQARGARRVSNRAEASLTLGFEGCTYDLRRPETVLSQLL